MNDKPTIKEYLASLGDNPHEIDKSLRAQGIKGSRHSPRHNIISNAINTQCCGWGGLKIHKSSAPKRWRYSATYSDLQIMDPVLPQLIKDFLGLFDEGHYPDLEGV